MNSDTIFIVGFLAFLSVVAVVLIGFIWTSFNEYAKNREKTQFLGDLRMAIKSSQPTWTQVNLMSSIRPLTKRDVSYVVRELLTEALKGDDSRLKPHVALLESYIAADQEQEPYEDMPQEIRIHLERLREQLPERPELLEALVDHLRDSKIRSVREKRRQSLISIVSLIIGLAGFVITVIAVLQKVHS
jgi:hypothetical protein